MGWVGGRVCQKLNFFIFLFRFVLHLFPQAITVLHPQSLFFIRTIFREDEFQAFLDHKSWGKGNLLSLMVCTALLERNGQLCRQRQKPIKCFAHRLPLLPYTYRSALHFCSLAIVTPLNTFSVGCERIAWLSFIMRQGWRNCTLVGKVGLLRGLGSEYWNIQGFRKADQEEVLI